MKKDLQDLNLGLVIAGSGGGSKQKGGVEADDTLKSSSKLVFVDVIGEGQIGGLVNGERSVFFDDTPLKNTSGEFNFSDVSWAMTHGTQSQEPLSNGYIDNVEYVTSKNVKITKENPITFTITDPNADAVRVILSVPALTSADDNGNINGSSVSFSFYISVNDGAYVHFADSGISGKTRSKYQKSFYGELPLVDLNKNKAKRWTFKIVKTSNDSNSSSTQNDLYLDSYATIISSKLSYPNTAIFGASINSEFFSSMPRRSYLVDGLLIKVPANRDAKTRTYDGHWNGQYKLEASDNPAWILFDIISNERYGLGQYIPAEFRNPARLYEIGKYCDEMVDNGFGGKEPRFSINTVISSLADAYQLLTDISSVFNGMIYWTGNDMGYMCDMPSEVSMLYNKTNIIGDIAYQSSDRKDRHSVAIISYNNPERNYEVEQEYIEDQELIARFGVRKTEITAFGCTTRGQAHRVGQWLLYTEKYQSSVITFNVGIDSAFVFPGDIIQIADPDRAGKRLGGRLFGFTNKTATLDDNINLSQFKNATILIRAKDGTLVKRKIKSSYTNSEIAKTVITWETPIEKDVVKGAIWVISSTDLEPITARVVSVTQVDGKDTEYSISAIRHLTSKFDHIEKNVALEIPKTSLIEHYAIDSTNSVSINGEKKIEQGITLYSMNIQWEQVKGASYYLVKYRKENGNWIELPHQDGLSVNIDGVFSGKYEAIVVAVSAMGAKSRPVLSALTMIDGSASILPKIAHLEANGVLFGIDLKWSFAQGTTGVTFTEIQQKRHDELDWEFLSNVVYPTNEYSLTGLTSVESRLFRVRIVDSFGVSSEWSEEIVGTSSADPQAVLDILEGQINESTLDGILTGKINNAIDTGVANTQAITAEQQARTKALAQEAQSRATAIRNEAIARSQEINQRVTALNSEIGTTIGELQNGLTQEIQQRKDGDSSTLAHLNAYKLSNDKAVSNALERINVTTSDIASNATKITALQNSLNTVNGTLDTKASTSALNRLQSQVTTIDGKVNAQASQITALQSNITTVKGSLATKLDSALISNYYTKAETDNVTAGKIDEFNTNLTIGGNNLIPESDKFRQGLAGNIAHRQILNDGSLKITGATNRFYNFISQQADLSLRNIHFKTGDSFIVSIWLKAVNPSQPPTEMPELYLSIDNAYKSNFEKTGSFENGGEVRYSQIRIANANRHLATPYVPHIGFSANAVGGGVIITRWQIQRGTKATDWTPALSDIDGKINTNAQAISTINSDVSTINGTLTAQSNQLTQLKNDLNTTNNNVASKANASALSALESNVSTINNTVISQSNLITALSGRITTAENSLKTKAESSAFNNYYTKQQTDNAIAGKVDEFSASLKIGGENLLRGTAEMKMGTGQWDTATFRPLSLGTAVTVDVPDSPVPLVKKGIRITSSRTSEFGIAQYLCPLDVGFYTLSYWVNGVAGDVVRLKPFWKDENQNTPSKRFTLKGGWERLTFTAENKVAGLRQHIGYIYLQPKVASNSLIVVAPMLEKATVASEWQPSQFDVQDNFNNLSSNITKTYVTKTELNNTKSEMTTALNSKLNTSDRNQIIADAQDGIKHIIDVSTLDGNTYYPVIIPLNHSRENKLSVFVSFNDGYTANWSTHSTKKWSVSLVWTDQGSGWGAQSRELVIDKFSYAWCANNQSPIIHVGQMTNSSYAYVFVRGGTKYNFYLSQGLTPQLKKDSFTQHSQTLNPQAYNANAVPKSMRNEMNAQATAINTLTTNVTTINGQLTTQAQQLTTLTTTQNNQATTINQQTQTINGISAVRAVTVDNNGVISGYGLMSELRNGRVTSQFGVNADTFYIGSPSNGKKPFIFNTSPRVIDGVSYPAGAWINSAYIANATIKMAHIQDSIQSDNFVAGRSGWRLYKNGTLEINGSLGDGTRIQLNHRGLTGYYANGKKAFELGIF